MYLEQININYVWPDVKIYMLESLHEKVKSNLNKVCVNMFWNLQLFWRFEKSYYFNTFVINSIPFVCKLLIFSCYPSSVVIHPAEFIKSAVWDPSTTHSLSR